MAAGVASSCRACPETRRSSQLVQLGAREDRWDYLVALAGNPNTGKSTVFNALTGLRQHTGNWPGKTVVRAEGSYESDGLRGRIVDLPGTYSLQAGSVDEEVARDFLLFGRPDVTVVVVDATRLERNLPLVLQILEITDRVVVCLNLVDEARRRGTVVDAAELETELGVPVVVTVARRRQGIPELTAAIHRMATGKERTRPFRIDRHPGEVESAITTLAPIIEDAFPGLPNSRWVALRLLNADERVEEAVRTGELGEFDSERAYEARPPDEAPSGSGAGDQDIAKATKPSDEGAYVLEAAASQRWSLSPLFHDALTESLYTAASSIANRVVVTGLRPGKFDFDRTIDHYLTSRVFGFPLMLAMLAVVFWLTIAGANVPSALLATLLVDNVHPLLKQGADAISLPWWLSGLLVDGIYLATAWVVSVMLPPMAIFFPLFTLLEDFGYLPRVAFNLDKIFRKVGAHGKQSLTMCMGFGCNAAGVVATRIIDSPRERLVAIITNNFSLCNGRWPTQILIASIFIGTLVPSALGAVASAATVVAVALLGVVAMFLSSWLLTRTVLRGEASTFSLELPPYRPPRFLQTLYTSLIDRTLIVLWRAIIFAVPAGAAIWLISNIYVGGGSLAHHAVGWLDPIGILLGLNGVILLAYVVAIPANEIVIPTILMLTVLTAGMTGVGPGAGVMFELDSMDSVAELLEAGGWTLLTAVNLMLFSLLHNPCSTTIYTIYRETRSMKWTTVATMLPLVMGFVVCFLVAQIWMLF